MSRTNESYVKQPRLTGEALSALAELWVVEKSRLAQLRAENSLAATVSTGITSRRFF
jgi:hypothetical protein